MITKVFRQLFVALYDSQLKPCRVASSIAKGFIRRLLMASMNARFAGTPATWIWHPVVPTHLEPFANQTYVSVGMETWWDWPYVLLDWKDDAGNVICRYACWVRDCWNPRGGWRFQPRPTLPALGWNIIALEVKARRHRDDFILRLDWGRNDVWNLLWIMTMHGCYVPP